MADWRQGGFRYARRMETDTATLVADEATDVQKDELLIEELLVEEISIDGMCGVY